MGITVYSVGYTSISNLRKLYEYPDKEEVDAVRLKNVIFNENVLSFTTSDWDLYFEGTFDTDSIKAPANAGDLRNLLGSIDFAERLDLDSYKGKQFIIIDEVNQDVLNLSNYDPVNALLGQYEDASYLYRFDDVFYASLDGDHVFGFDGNDVFYGSFERLPSRPNEKDLFVGGDGIDRIIFEEKSTDIRVVNSIEYLGWYVPGGTIESGFNIINNISSEMTYINSVEFLQFEDVTYRVDYEDKVLRTFKKYSLDDDLIELTGGAEYIDGGDGLDTLALDAEYIPLNRTDSGYKVSDNELVNIERIQFADANVALDTEGATSAGGIYRLYKATFNREPDTGGLGYWIAQADADSKDAVSMAEAFTWSAEFQDVYNTTTTDNYGTGTDVSELVKGFYENVLGRTPDAGGLNYYTGVIESHAKTVGRVLAEISDSAENYDNTIELIQNGIQYDLWVG